MRKILSVLLCMCMVLGMLPVVTSADKIDEPAWLKDIGLSDTPGTLVGNYSFTGKDIPGESVENNFGKNGYYTAEYTDAGFKVTKSADYIDDGRKSGQESGEWGRINFAIKPEADSSSTQTYQYGMHGKYIVDVDVLFNVKGADAYGSKDVRFEWAFRYDDDLTTLPASFSARGNCGIFLCTKIRAKKIRQFTMQEGSSTGAAAVGPTTGFSMNKNVTIRFAVDTVGNTISRYVKTEGGNFAYMETSNGYTGNILQSLVFSPRQELEKNSYFIFKNVRIYEIEKTINAESGDEDRNKSVENALADQTVFPEYLASNPDAVTESLTLSEGNWTSSNEETITTSGVVTRGYDNQKVVLQKTFETKASPTLKVVKNYNLTVLRRDDVNEETIAEYDFKENADCDKLIYSDKETTELDSLYGLKIKQTEGAVIDSSEANATGNNVIAAVTREIASDANSSTYVSNLSGVYDFEIGVIPNVSKDGKPVTLEPGYYDEETGTFTSYATLDMYNNVAMCKGNFSTADEKYESAISNNIETEVKFKVDTKNNKVWVYLNGNKSSAMTYKGNGYVNAFRVSIDKNSDSGDSITLLDANVKSLFTFDHEDFVDADIKACADEVAKLGIDAVTGNPSDAYGEMGDLPDTIGNYKVEWSTDSQFVDLSEKYIYRTTEKQNVVVTAKIYDEENQKVSITKEFYISVDGTTDPEYLLESIKGKLSAKNITNQPEDALITDIALPTAVDGSTISWESSNTDILSVEDNDKGVIAKNVNIAETTTVTLTATISKDGATVTKSVDFSLAKRGADVTLYENSADIETPFTGVVTYEADMAEGATLSLKDSNGKKIIDLDEVGTVKVVMDFNNKKVSVFVNGELVSDYIDFTEAAENFADVIAENVSNEKIVLDEYALYNYNVEKFGYLDEIGKGYITGNVNMPVTSVGGVTVSWDMNDNIFLTSDGIYTAPDTVSFFDVDLSVTLPDGTGSVYKKTINCIAIPENNIFSGAKVENSGVSVPAGKYQSTSAFDGDFSDTMFRASFEDETKNIVIDMKNEQNITNIYIANEGLKSCDIYVSDDKENWTLVASHEFDGTNESNYVSFNKQNVRYVKISNIKYDGEYVDLYEISGYSVYSSSDKSYMDIQALNMPSEYVLTTSSITLPATGVRGSTFTWQSSDPSVISTSGVITKPKNDTEVLLTVTSTNGTESSTKTFRYLIKGSEGAQGAKPAGGGSGSGGGGTTYIGDTSSSAFPETNTVVQTPVATPGKLFADVENTDWFYTYVYDLKNDNIIDGDNNNRFNPYNYVTREEFVKMIVNAANIELAANGEGFNDVKSTDWFAPYVYAAKANGIVNGTSATTFGVGSPISRQDMSVIINNIIDIDADISTNRDIFKDDASISSYAYKAVYSMKALGILNGYESGEFNPRGQLTRAEAAKVIAMVMDIIK